jgi:hypothetical protein
MMTAIHTDPMQYGTPANLNARGRRLLKAQDTANAQIWCLTHLISLAVARFVTPDPAREIVKVERREAARRAVDNLLLR